MAGQERWTFVPDEDAQEFIDHLQQEVETLDSRTDAINFTINLQRELVQSGGIDLLFEVMSTDDITIHSESEKEVLKEAVKEAIAEMEAEQPEATAEAD